jgi:hypothetical protein
MVRWFTYGIIFILACTRCVRCQDRHWCGYPWPSATGKSPARPPPLARSFPLLAPLPMPPPPVPTRPMGLTAPPPLPPHCKGTKKFPNQEIPQEHWNPHSISVRNPRNSNNGTDDGSGGFRGCFNSHPQNSSKWNQGLLHFSSPKKQFKTQKNSSKRNQRVASFLIPKSFHI